jgi:hypothetical protein
VRTGATDDQTGQGLRNVASVRRGDTERYPGYGSQLAGHGRDALPAAVPEQAARG